jgi:hypothetical protein
MTADASMNFLAVESADFTAVVREQAVAVPVTETFTASVPEPVHISGTDNV